MLFTEPGSQVDQPAALTAKRPIRELLRPFDVAFAGGAAQPLEYAITNPGTGPVHVDDLTASVDTAGSDVKTPGGADVTATGTVKYGNGGSLSILAGQDPGLASLVGNTFTLDSTLEDEADRMGRLRTSNGIIYEIAQWYPRVCVYDDVEGWNTLPYMGLGEFYCDYGNFDYYITAPAAMTVVASGDLQNPAEVLTPKEIGRLDKARNSDSTVMIVDLPEINQPSTRPKTQGSLTWHYKMIDSRDVSWAASTAFIWDAARVNFPSGRKGISMSAYPVESAGNDRYGRSTQYLKRSIELYSSEYFEYPWNSAVSVAGVALGMEYPGIVFCQSGLQNGNLFNDITHEIGHNWFPMIVGSNERRFMWMDEGLNTFINQYTTEKFNNGEYIKDIPTPDFMYRTFRNERFPLMTAPEGMDLNGYGSYYFKTAAGLDLLRNIVLDPDRFDYAFNTYISRWAFKHPQPDDFFRTMNNAAGEKLDWFWREWFYTTWTLDQSVKDVKYVNGNPANGCLITLENLSQMALPVIVQINEANGQSPVIKLPVDIWQRQGPWIFKFNSTDSITSVVLDPDHVLPDINRSNNVWKAQ